jgi:metal-responsive CopG/Arc/MetJ family transcriptional regulator
MIMKTFARGIVKTTVIFDQALVDEIDRINPYPTRTEFLARASKEYLERLKRSATDEQLAAACFEAAEEDRLENDEWENITLETWP